MHEILISYKSRCGLSKEFAEKSSASGRLGGRARAVEGAAGGVGRAALDGAATVFVTGTNGAAGWMARAACAFACAFAALILRAFCLLASICSLVRFITLAETAALAARCGCSNAAIHRVPEVRRRAFGSFPTSAPRCLLAAVRH